MHTIGESDDNGGRFAYWRIGHAGARILIVRWRGWAAAFWFCALDRPRGAGDVFELWRSR